MDQHTEGSIEDDTVSRRTLRQDMNNKTSNPDGHNGQGDTGRASNTKANQPAWSCVVNVGCGRKYGEEE
ncbi:hypothetical protein Pcinc_017746 [Petrolisthes cinctipes]|uniref:Uncharacterized protein n=1 Tax=Petrolisthes cinctipes TaxID=88211 RepID=A0AAE1KN67_PETCI|nr:hypothetical protein Pcinc_017746 [Petrolisthes cinctipes]